ncbi:5726_t:CDS:1 [Ambispora leptoticha]|uniref:5726_t:CDS:1 n=1 Tax=Ambispora leptoticha TaxID=144679 RepID=A0A9N9AJE2_9GLOM|nr:5726_t:CDS:1 [Ambispora leptoticha]
MENNPLYIELNQQIKELQGENRRLHTRTFPSSTRSSSFSQKNSLKFDASEEEKKSKLAQEVATLQNLLHVFAFVKGRNVIVNERAANNLLLNYLTPVPATGSNGKASKNHLGAALQRHLIESVLRVLTNKFNDQQEQHQQPFIVDNKGTNEILSNESKLELKILSAADKLLNLMTNLRPSKNTNNEFMLALSHKIRYDIFSSINLYSIENSERLYREIQQLVLKEMDKYRTSLVSPEKIKLDSENLAIKITSLFYQFKILDIKEVRFFGSGTILDRKTMDAGYFDDDEDSEYQIDLCYFPLITMVGLDGEEQVVSKAKVLLRPKNHLSFETSKDVVLPLLVSAEKPSSADNTSIDGYDVVQSMTSGCWRSGSSNCEPEKAQLRKERDELKQTCELLLDELEAGKQSQKKQEQEVSQQQSELAQTCERLQLELKNLNLKFSNLSEERDLLEDQNKDGLNTLTKLQTENELLKKKMSELINETREQQRRGEQREMELETKLVEVQRQASAQIELYKDQIEAQSEQFVEEKEALLNEMQQLKQAAESHQNEETSASVWATPPADDEFVLVD